MANSKNSVYFDNIEYRKIPGFANYGISSNGGIINIKTGYLLVPKDLDHYSGRYTLYRNGRATTINALTMVSRLYSERTTRRFMQRAREAELMYSGN